MKIVFSSINYEKYLYKTFIKQDVIKKIIAKM